MLIDRKRAIRRLARVNYSAGKMFLAQRRLAEADEFLSKAIRFAPGYFKTYPFWFACKVARILQLSRS